jgi:hypothetical protein
VKSTLTKVSQALAGIQSLTVAECERAFGCKFLPDDANPRQYWGTCPDPNIDLLDVRIGETGGIIVVQFAEGVRPILAEELRSWGAPDDIDIVSPPISPASAPAWTRKLSVAYTIGGAKIWFSMEEIDGSERLVSASRSFTFPLIFTA